MKRRLMVTVDVEAQRRRSAVDPLDRLIWGRFPEGEFGIGAMMSIAERHGVRLVTYLDYAEEQVYGDALLDVGRVIAGRGHDLQLHIHPDFFPAAFYARHGIAPVGDLNRTDERSARVLVDFLCEMHQRAAGVSPVAFRGGGYRFCGAILGELARHGIPIDSSYNPTRSTQPMNVGPKKQFYWDDGTLEIPISCVHDFMGLERLVDYNFNGSALWPSDIKESAAWHLYFLDDFYRVYGEEAIAVLVMHSWSFLKLDTAGHYSVPLPDARQRFDELLSALKGSVAVVTATDLSRLAPAEISAEEKVSFQYGLTSAVSSPTASAMASAAGGGACSICGTEVAKFQDYNGKARRCPACGSLERQRVFATLYRDKIGASHDLAGKRVLVVRPSAPALRTLKSLGPTGVVTLDVRPNPRVDLFADLCQMPHVPDDGFDALFACDVLASVHDLKACLREFRRILRPGGVLFCSDSIRRGRATEEFTDLARITAWHGIEPYEKYRLGIFRALGDRDLLATLNEYFISESMVAPDVATGTRVTWYVAVKPIAAAADAVTEALPGVKALSGAQGTMNKIHT